MSHDDHVEALMSKPLARLEDQSVIIEFFGLTFRTSSGEAERLRRCMRDLQDQASRVPDLLVQLDQVERQRNQLARALGQMDVVIATVRRDFAIPLRLSAPAAGTPTTSAVTDSPSTSATDA